MCLAADGERENGRMKRIWTIVSVSVSVTVCIGVPVYTCISALSFFLFFFSYFRDSMGDS